MHVIIWVCCLVIIRVFAAYGGKETDVFSEGVNYNSGI